MTKIAGKSTGLLTVRETAELLNLTIAQTDTLLRRNQIESRIYVLAASVAEYQASHR